MVFCILYLYKGSPLLLNLLNLNTWPSTRNFNYSSSRCNKLEWTCKHFKCDLKHQLIFESTTVCCREIHVIASTTSNNDTYCFSLPFYNFVILQTCVIVSSILQSCFHSVTFKRAKYITSFKPVLSNNLK